MHTSEIGDGTVKVGTWWSKCLGNLGDEATSCKGIPTDTFFGLMPDYAPQTFEGS